VHDPREGVTAQGTIRTGAARDAVLPGYEPIIRAAMGAVPAEVALYLYGSVATGTAVPPTSDVDLLSIGLPADEAERLSAELSARSREECREVSIGPATWQDLDGDGDAAYGLRVFLRHYCLHLAGPDPAADLPGYPADAAAARGFNGDIGRHATAWAAALQETDDIDRLSTRIARKTLLAVAGIVSVRDGTWSTDRRGCAARWDQQEPETSVARLVAWLDTPPRDRGAVDRVLSGPVAAIVRAFEAEIGLWRE